MSRKVRPCKKGCGYPAVKGRQFCYWHVMLRASSDVQAKSAQGRLAAAPQPHRPRVPKGEWPEGERWCAGCQTMVPLFYCSGSRCKACAGMAAHERRVEKTYGITAEEYDRIFYEVQGGRCAICRNRPATIRFAVDHDHKTGAVRGVLCKRCNHDLLGGGHDSVDVLFRAIEYLLYPPAERDARPSRERVLAALQEHLDLRDQLNAPRAAQGDPEPPF